MKTSPFIRGILKTILMDSLKLDYPYVKEPLTEGIFNGFPHGNNG